MPAPPGGRCASSSAKRDVGSAASATRSPCSTTRPSIEHEHLIGPLDRAEPVGDDDAGPAGEQPVDGVLQQRLGVGVEPRRRLVEHDQPGVLQEHAGEGDELRLARRQTARQSARARCRARRAARPTTRRAPAPRTRRRAGRRPRRGRTARTLSRSGAGEELHVLGDEADAPPEVVDPQVADVDAADAHRAAVDVVEAEERAGRSSSCPSRCGRGGRERDRARRGTTPAAAPARGRRRSRRRRAPRRSAPAGRSTPAPSVMRGAVASSSRTRTMPPIARWKLFMCRDSRSSGMRSIPVYRNTR